jgi:hypothetical protein
MVIRNGLKELKKIMNEGDAAEMMRLDSRTEPQQKSHSSLFLEPEHARYMDIVHIIPMKDIKILN